MQGFSWPHNRASRSTSQTYPAYSQPNQYPQAEYSDMPTSASSRQDHGYAAYTHHGNRYTFPASMHVDHGGSGISTASQSYSPVSQTRNVSNSSPYQHYYGQSAPPQPDAPSTLSSSHHPPVSMMLGSTAPSTYYNSLQNDQGLAGSSHSSTSSTAPHGHYAVDNGGECACACGKIFTGAAKNANANRKRHIETKKAGSVYACPNRNKGCTYVANRKDNVAAHYHRACRYGDNAP